MGVLVGSGILATAAILGTGGAAAPIILGTGNTVYVGTSGAVAATAAATGGGAAATGVGAAATGVGAAAGAGAVTGAGAGTVSVGILSGPIGWTILGAEETENKSISFDCWKKIIHDESTEKSEGRILRYVCQDKRIKQFQANNNQFIIENIWNEKFQIDFYYYPKCDQYFAHAIPINCE